MKKELSKKDQIIVGIGANILLCLIYYIFFYSADIDSQIKRNKMLTTEKSNFLQYQANYNSGKINDLQMQLETMREESIDLFKKVIKSDDILSLVKEISIIAPKYGVDVSFTSINQGSPMNIYDEDKKIMMKKLPINIGLECHVRELIKYLALLENMREYLVVDYINVGVTRQDMIKCQITLVAYLEEL